MIISLARAVGILEEFKTDSYRVIRLVSGLVSFYFSIVLPVLLVNAAIVIEH